MSSTSWGSNENFDLFDKLQNIVDENKIDATRIVK